MVDSFHRVALLVVVRVLAVALLAWGSPVASAEDARELVRQAWQEGSKKPAIAQAVLASESGGETRDLEMKRMRVGDQEKIHIKVLSPYHYKGVRYVFLEEGDGRHDHYSYLPAMKRTLRIAEDSLSQPFLNSTFYVADLIPPDLSAYEYEVVGEEQIGGRACRLIESRSKTGNPLYGKTVLAIDPVDRVIVRTEFFDRDERPLKVWTVERFEKIDDVWTPMEQKMTPADGSAPWKLTIREIEYGVVLDDGDFNPIGLDG